MSATQPVQGNQLTPYMPSNTQMNILMSSAGIASGLLFLTNPSRITKFASTFMIGGSLQSLFKANKSDHEYAVAFFKGGANSVITETMVGAIVEPGLNLAGNLANKVAAWASPYTSPLIKTVTNYLPSWSTSITQKMGPLIGTVAEEGRLAITQGSANVISHVGDKVLSNEEKDVSKNSLATAFVSGVAGSAASGIFRQLAQHDAAELFWKDRGITSAKILTVSKMPEEIAHSVASKMTSNYFEGKHALEGMGSSLAMGTARGIVSATKEMIDPQVPREKSLFLAMQKRNAEGEDKSDFCKIQGTLIRTLPSPGLNEKDRECSAASFRALSFTGGLSQQKAPAPATPANQKPPAPPASQPNNFNDDILDPDKLSDSPAQQQALPKSPANAVHGKPRVLDPDELAWYRQFVDSDADIYENIDSNFLFYDKVFFVPKYRKKTSPAQPPVVPANPGQVQTQPAADYPAWELDHFFDGIDDRIHKLQKQEKATTGHIERLVEQSEHCGSGKKGRAKKNSLTLQIQIHKERLALLKKV